MNEPKSKYEILNDQRNAAMKRLAQAVDARDDVSVEFEDREVQRLVSEMRAELRRS